MNLSKCMGCMEPFQSYPCPECGFSPEAQKGNGYSLPMETILAGKYLLGKVLGQGGFGITYIGWDLILERKVAIKEYYPSGQVSRIPGTKTLTWYTNENAREARQDGMQMFLKEARKMTKVEDIPGIVKIRELFQENETAYIVMDFVEGRTLKSILQENGPITWEQAKPIFLSAIRTMERVHKVGLVHRDLSPDNLMICPEGNVRILDLGAAKDLNTNAGASSMQVAKSGFSPLEQYLQRGASGPWTDVYAMAATVYYTLTGILPPSAVERMNDDTIRWDHPNLQALPAFTLKALREAMVVPVKQRTQSMTELKKGLFTEEVKPEPKPKPQRKPKPKPTKEDKNTQSEKDTQRKPLPKWLVPAAVAAVVVVAIGIFALKPVIVKEAYLRAQRGTSLSVGAIHAVGLRSNGTVIATGSNIHGQCDLDSWRDIVSVAAGNLHSVGLRRDGTVFAAGSDAFGQCRVTQWRDVMAVAAKYNHTVGLRSDGTVVAVGGNDYGQCSVKSWKNIVAIATGATHTVGLRSNGTVVAAGDNASGQCNVSGWTDIVAVEAGQFHTVGLRSNGTVVVAGQNSNGQCNTSSWKDIVAITAGNNYTIGLRSDGTVIAIGKNNDAQCDVSKWKDIRTPK